MAGLDLYDLLNSDEPTAMERAQAMSQALRRRASIADAEQLSGNPTLAKTGATLAQSNEAGQQRLGQLLLERPGHLKAMAEMKAANQRRQDLSDPASVLSQTRYALGQRFGMKLPPNTPGSSIDDKELDLAEKATQAEENRKMREVMARAAAGRADLRHEEKQDQFDTHREDTLAKQAGDYLSAFNARGGLKGYSDTISRVSQIKGQVLDPATGMLKAQLDPRQMAEMGITLQQAVANGHANGAEVEKLIPNTFGGNVAKAAEYFTGHPWDTGQRAIAEKMLHSAVNAAEVAHGRIVDAYRENVPSLIGGLRGIGTERARKRADALLRNHHINPAAIDENGDVVDGVPFELPANGATGAAAPHGPSGAVPATHDPRYLYNKADGGRTRILKGPDGKTPAPGAKAEPTPPAEVAANG